MTRRAGWLLLLACTGCKTLPEQGEANDRWTQARTRAALQEAARGLQAGDLASARRHLAHAVAMGSTSPRVHLLLARIALEEGRFEECRAELAIVRGLDPDGSSADFVLGMLAEAQERWNDAAEAYALVAARRPDDLAPVLAQVRALHASGRSEEAQRRLQEELERRPQSIGLNLAVAEDQLAAGNLDRALLHFEKVLLYEPGHEAALRGKGSVLHRAGRHEEAVPVLRACGKDPDVLLALGQSALVAGDYGTAVEAFRARLEAAGREPGVLFDLARALFLQGREEESRRALLDVLALDPDFSDAVVLQGHLRYRAGEWEEAVLTYQAALRIGADAAVVQSFIEAAKARGRK